MGVTTTKHDYHCRILQAEAFHSNYILVFQYHPHTIVRLWRANLTQASPYPNVGSFDLDLKCAVERWVVFLLSLYHSPKQEVLVGCCESLRRVCASWAHQEHLKARELQLAGDRHYAGQGAGGRALCVERWRAQGLTTMDCDEGHWRGHCHIQHTMPNIAMPKAAHLPCLFGSVLFPSASLERRWPSCVVCQTLASSRFFFLFRCV